MGMPTTVEICDSDAQKADLEEIFSFFRRVDRQFSPYKKTSEVMRINTGELELQDISTEMKEIIELGTATKEKTGGYFDMYHNGYFDPTGIVKGWAIQKARDLLKKRGFSHFFIEAGGDISVSGKNKKGKKWRVGIRHPFDRTSIVKVLEVENEGIATSGTYIRGEHISSPQAQKKRDSIVSLTVIGPTILDADSFATAAFAMGEKGLQFIEQRRGFEAYMINKDGLAAQTSGFGKYIA